LTTVSTIWPPLVGGDAQELAGAAQRDQAMDAFLDLEIDQTLECRLVDFLAVGRERV
jgi:hypothetical protein